MVRGRPRQPRWVQLTDRELLELRFCDLDLRLENTPLQGKVDRLYGELGRRDIRFRPHCWLSEEWFSPDGIPGIAIPFYLAHPRLAKLESRQMFEVEGGNERWCMQLLRHEAGHAIDTAYQLHRRKRWRELFGRRGRPYPTHYTPDPKSRSYVLHLEWWYAQSHPAEDFAETFAVWLTPRSKWRSQYADWPALRKLEYVDELMASIAGRVPAVRSRRQVDPLGRIRKTLGEHYAEKRAHYGIEVPEFYDGDLRRLFDNGSSTGRRGRRRSAAAFLREIRTDLCHRCAHGTGEHPYVIAQIVQEMIVRCRALGLTLERPEVEAEMDLAIFVAVHTLNYLHQGHHRIPV